MNGVMPNSPKKLAASSTMARLLNQGGSRGGGRGSVEEEISA